MPLPTTGITSIDDYSPIYIGDTLIPFATQFWQWSESSGQYEPFNLTGLTISMKMQEANGEVQTCTANWIVDSAVNGKAHYPWNSADVATPGVWTLYITLTNTGGQAVHTDTKVLTILEAV